MPDTLLTRPPALTAEQVQQILGAGQDKTVNINGVDYGTVGLATNDEGGQGYQVQGITGYRPGTVNQAGAQRAEYDLNGNFTRMGANQKGGVGSFLMDTVGDLSRASAPLLAMYTLGQGLALAGAGSAGGLFGSGIGAGGQAADAALTVQGNSINALDRATGVAYGSEAPGSFLTGPTDAGANYNILSSTYVPDPQSVVLDGNAGQGINLAKASGTGLTMPTAPNLDVMGGAQGLTTAASGGGTVSAAGTFNPYVPNLGDPSSFVNGGPAGASASSAPYNWADMLKGAQTGLSIVNTLGAMGSLGGGGGQASYSGGGVGGTADTTRAGAAPMGSAMGGAAGSLEGVANTLLTAKDQFGYGKTMLG